MLLAVIGLLAVPDLVLLWAVIAGFGQGCSLVVALTLIGLRGRTPHETTQLSGMAQSVGYLLAAAGPVAAGALAERTGGWDAALTMMGVLAVVQITIAFGAGRDRRPALALRQQHRVAERVEPVALADRELVQPPHLLLPGERHHQREQRRARQVEVRHQRVDDPERVRRLDLETGSAPRPAPPGRRPSRAPARPWCRPRRRAGRLPARRVTSARTSGSTA